MKIVNTRDAFISDYEAIKFLSTLQRKNKWDEQSLKNNKRTYYNLTLQNMISDTLAYLEVDKNYIPNDEEEDEDVEDGDANKVVKGKSPLLRFNDNKFTDLINELKKFELYQIELLQIVNQLPTNMVHLFALVEECDSRYSEVEIEEMIAIIGKYI